MPVYGPPESLADTIFHPRKLSPAYQGVQGFRTSFSGCDITAVAKAGNEVLKLGNISTLSYSIHREKVPVRTIGRTYPKAYTRGSRTIAGTLVFTVLEEASLMKLIQWNSFDNPSDEAMRTFLTDQIPPFDISISFSDEMGHDASMSIYGVEIVDEGQTHSVDDMFTENIMQYVARDIDLLVAGTNVRPLRTAAFRAATEPKMPSVPVGENLYPQFGSGPLSQIKDPEWLSNYFGDIETPVPELRTGDMGINLQQPLPVGDGYSELIARQFKYIQKRIAIAEDAVRSLERTIKVAESHRSSLSSDRATQQQQLRKALLQEFYPTGSDRTSRRQPGTPPMSYIITVASDIDTLQRHLQEARTTLRKWKEALYTHPMYQGSDVYHL